MSITVEAIYENGVLKPSQALPLHEREKVRLTVETIETPMHQAYGIMGWAGTSEALSELAMDQQFDPQEDS